MSRARMSTAPAWGKPLQRCRSTSPSRNWASLRAGSRRKLIRRNPQKLRQLVTREGELPFDVSARVALAETRGFSKRQSAIQMRDEMRHGMRTHDRQRGIKLAAFKRLDFLESAGGEHLVEARVDRGAQGSARGCDEKAQTVLCIEQRFGAAGLKTRKR